PALRVNRALVARYRGSERIGPSCTMSLPFASAQFGAHSLHRGSRSALSRSASAAAMATSTATLRCNNVTARLSLRSSPRQDNGNRLDGLSSPQLFPDRLWRSGCSLDGGGIVA